jgi:dTDP-glucose 4,6-dehydratase
MNVLVTGGAGFIGSAFVRLILNNLKGFDSLKKLVVLDSLTYSGNLENLEEVKIFKVRGSNW